MTPELAHKLATLVTRFEDVMIHPFYRRQLRKDYPDLYLALEELTATIRKDTKP